MLYLMDYSEELLGSSEIHREPHYQIWMRSNQLFIWRPQALLYGHNSYFNMSSALALLFLIDFSQKSIGSSKCRENNLIKYKWYPNKVHKISRTQAFWVAIFSKCHLLAILLIMESSQQLVRWSDIHREPPYQIWIRSNHRVIIITAPTSFLVAILENGGGSVPSELYDPCAQAHRSYIWEINKLIR